MSLHYSKHQGGLDHHQKAAETVIYILGMGSSLEEFQETIKGREI